MTIPLTGVPLGEHRALIEELPDLGYTDVWSAETAFDGTDAITRFAQPEPPCDSSQRSRDTLRFLRSALAGEKVTEEYETFSVSKSRLG